MEPTPDIRIAPVVIRERVGPNPMVMLVAGLSVGALLTGYFLRGQNGVSTTTVAKAGPVRVPAPLLPPRVGSQTLNPTGVAKPLPPDAPAAKPVNPDTAGPVDPFDGMVLPTPQDGGANPMKGFILPRSLPVLPPSPSLSAPPTVTPPSATGTGKPAPTPTLPPTSPTAGIPKSPPILSVKPSTPKVVAVQSVAVGSDTAKIAAEIVAEADRLGGKAVVLSEPDGSRTAVRGVQATVPDASVSELLKFAQEAGAAVVDRSAWTGDSGQRSQRLVQEAESRLASLRKLRDALLVTYLEDAQPVKDVDAEIAEAQRAVDDAKAGKASEKMTVVKFSFRTKS